MCRKNKSKLDYGFILGTIIICLLIFLVFFLILDLHERKVQNKILKELSHKTDSLKNELIIIREGGANE